MNHEEAMKIVLEREKAKKEWTPYVENRRPEPLKYGKGSYFLTLEESNGFRHVCEASYSDCVGWLKVSYDGHSICLPEYDEKIVAYMVREIPTPYAD